MGRRSDRRAAAELADSLVQRKHAQEASTQRARETAAAREAAETAKLETAFSKLSDLAGYLLAHHPDRAQLIQWKRSREVPSGFLKNKSKTETWQESVAAWEIMRSDSRFRWHGDDRFGPIGGSPGRGYEHGSLMIAADGRLLAVNTLIDQGTGRMIKRTVYDDLLDLPTGTARYRLEKWHGVPVDSASLNSLVDDVRSGRSAPRRG